MLSARIGQVVKSLFTRLRLMPAAAPVVEVQGADGETRDVELYHPPGISSAPTEGDSVVMVPIRAGYRVGVASRNYGVSVNVTAGAITVYSTNAAGDTIQARIDLDDAGNVAITPASGAEVKVSGDTKSFVTYAELNTALQTMVGAFNAALGNKTDGSGTPGAVTLDISASETTTVKTGG
jgi:hypothetical protein